jgi:hypothetical protein
VASKLRSICLEKRRRRLRQLEVFEDASVQSLLGLLVEPAELAAVFEWVWQVDEVCFCRVVQERPERVRRALCSLEQEIGDERGVLCDGVERAAVSAEAALV